jgi:hypothetical protein
LTKASAPDRSPATSENSGASCVQPTVTGSPLAAAARNRSISARQSWFAVFTWAPRQPREIAPASIGMVFSQEHTRMVRFFRHFSSGLVPPAIPRSPRHALGYNDPN